MDGDWNLRGCGRNDPNRLKSPEEAAALIREIGFLPLFSVGIPGFSIEERVVPFDWWTDDPERDPWIWRMMLAEYDDIVRKYRSEGWGIFDDTADMNRSIACTDGYYGDWSSLVQLYEKTGKMIMIQYIEDLEEVGKK